MKAASHRIQLKIKRLGDIFCAGVLLAILSPFLLITAIAIFFIMGRPVVFVQERPGKNAEPFRLIKFRTMLDSRDKEGRILPDEERISRFGTFLRSTSIDEIPALINVLRGDMSIVGPRPLLMRYVRHYNDFQFRRHEMRPGITGLAQISGRNSLTWDDTFAMDIAYIDNWSLWTDLKVIFLTPFAALRVTSTTDGVRKIGRRPFDHDR